MSRIDVLLIHPKRTLGALALVLIAVGIALAAYVVTPGPLNNFVDFGVLYMNPLGITPLFALSLIHI